MVLTNLRDYVNEAKERYDKHANEFFKRFGVYPSIPFEDENLIYAVLDYYGAMGEFTADDLEFWRMNTDITEDDINYILEE